MAAVVMASPVSATLSSGYNETCNSWNTAYWSYTWNKPTVSNGHWVFTIPQGVQKNVQANYKLDSGYGIYELRFKIDGARNSGVVYWFFLYGHYPDYSINQQELDFFELWFRGSGHAIGEYSLSFWVNGSTGTMGVAYDYLNTLTEHSINFEDGQYHLFSYNYSATDLIISIDGVEIWSWLEDCTNQNVSDVHPVNQTTHSRIGYLGMPIPPMQLMVGLGTGSHPATTSSNTMTVDYISYTLPNEETPPANDTLPNPNPPDESPAPYQTGSGNSGSGGGGAGVLIAVLFLVAVMRGRGRGRSN